MKKTSRHLKITGIYVRRADLEQMILHYVYREGMSQKGAARKTGISITLAHNICNRVELKAKPKNPRCKPHRVRLRLKDTKEKSNG